MNQTAMHSIICLHETKNGKQMKSRTRIVEKIYDGRIPPLKSLLELFSLEKKYDDVPGFSVN